jgi:hypothetical protein
MAGTLSEHAAGVAGVGPAAAGGSGVCAAAAEGRAAGESQPGAGVVAGAESEWTEAVAPPAAAA